MPRQRFTERAQRVIDAAHVEASLAEESYATPEHLLLALLKEEESTAARVLDRMGQAAEAGRQIQCQVETRRFSRSGGDDAARELQARWNVGWSRQYGRLNYEMRRLDSRLKRVLDLACGEARQANSTAIGTEHLLLAILHEKCGAAYCTLAQLWITIIAVRQEIAAYQAGKPPQPVHHAPYTPSQPHLPRPGFIYQAEQFTNPATATAWLNNRARKGFRFTHCATTPTGELWILVQSPTL